MASGVEVAGLVLGSLPLILAGLQFYAEGMAVSRRFRKYRREVENLIIEITAENADYKNSIMLLLIGVVSSKDMAAFLADPGGELWKEKSFDQKLRMRLGGSYDAYMGIITYLYTTTKKLESRLKLTEGGKPQFTQKELFKDAYKRLKFSLKKSDYDDLMSTVRHANSSIRNLTGQALKIEARQDRSPLNRPSTPDFNVIKQRAEGFYSALCTSWGCKCTAQHSVSLRLEQRLENHTTDEDHGNFADDHFHVLFQYDRSPPPDPGVAVSSRPWTWDEAEVHVVLEKSKTGEAAASVSSIPPRKSVRFSHRAAEAVEAALKSTPDLRPISDLCSAIQSLQGPQRDVCFSLLKDEIIRQRYGFLVYPIENSPYDTDHWSVSSLRAAVAKGMTRRYRLQLAVTLASSVLQLHETSWLSDDWSIDSVFFVERPGIDAYDYPFVAQRFHQASSRITSAIPGQMVHVIPNQALYGLGIALIELWYGKTLAELHEIGDGPLNLSDSEKNFLTTFNTAYRLISELEDEAGEMYSGAVRRCIQCDFQSRARNFRDAQFQKAVFEGVVAQLKANYDFLHAHSGRSS
ncbi:hypothetical protein EKO04_006823 [Ascochyta lentis]|uniref:DUF7580 domain-containing protein n=1 Tax=Ascochyta lentis TaxID=205686 RepID=A0A8H7MHG9_9PLEO|nr:hypothetical protein EKO04_006823 [Ascochyta lentis]